MRQDKKILQMIAEFEDCFEDVVALHELKLNRAVGASASIWALLQHARTVCLPIGREIEASTCLSCDHFIGCKSSGSSVFIECWTHERRTASS